MRLGGEASHVCSEQVQSILTHSECIRIKSCVSSPIGALLEALA